jgi:putative ABC transport system permease protein
MIKNYLVTALRQLWKNKSYSTLNATGLIAGIVCFLLIAVYVNHELGYDRYHEKGNRIYRLALGSLKAGKMSSCVSGGVMPQVLNDEYAGIENFVRFRHLPSLVAYQSKSFFEDRFFFTDSSVFSVFSFKLREGNVRTALADPFTVVLTESATRKYFGNDNAIGQLLTVDEAMTFKVTGVMEDVPPNSHLHFDMLASTASLTQHPQPNVRTWQLTSWYSHYFHNYILLEENADPAQVDASIREAARYHSDQEMYQSFGKNMGLFLQPLHDIHLNPIFGEIETQGDRKILLILGGVAALVLLLASVNFSNVNMMLSLGRLKEVGLRKTFGARKSQVYLQFIGESLLLSVVTFVVGTALVQAGLPWFNAFTGKDIQWTAIFAGNNLTIISGVAALVGIAGGIWPALAAGRHTPAKVLKGIADARSPLTVRKSIVITQFAISIILISGSLVVWKQMDHMLSKDLGLDSNQVIVVPTHGDPAVAARLDVFFQQLQGIPGVTSFTSAELIPGEAVFGIVGIFEGHEIRNFSTMGIGYDYLKTFGMDLVAGRDFSPEIQTDTSTNCVIINESLSRTLGWTAEQAIGKSYNMGNEIVRPGKVIGVVRDFHFNSLRQEIQPIVMSYIPHFFSKIPIRIETTNMSRTIDVVGKAWKTVYPSRPFDFRFADAALHQQYQSEQKFGKLVTYFSFIAIAIGLLGMVGMVSLDLALRTREIGIRKVLGAGLSGLVGHLSKSFLALVIIAAGISIPLSIWVGKVWLAGFAYRIDSLALPVILPAAGVILIAALVVCLQTLRTALMNPADSLRSE